MSGESKREAVRRALLDLIADLPNWHPLPPERQLAEQLNVARMTLRTVMDELAAEGRVIRQPGRGAFVSSPKLSYPAELTSFSDYVEGRGLKASSRTVEFSIAPAGPQQARQLGISPRDHVVRAVRLRLADGEPMAVERLHVAEARVPGLTAEDLEQHSFYAMLKERWGITVHSGTRVTEATCTDEHESELLGVPLYTPAFLFERTTQDADATVIEFVSSVYRGDRYRFITNFGSAGSPTTITETYNTAAPPGTQL
ncbi:GntR family transcriptional regulator [Phytoactinopolyspora mesophila]|uniref:UTRA domain-containing protein n=1 Tax=Phytoactinopolyspora mesophila TaxID=2650750 RepID=A0A7K3M2H1_9ACTN|nr:GntR family transcriptional regulator [Phytoactinopolyspora mesophila]NDL57450.1 UTRA domain-containing protein [Phytoactinopolyspora mesophila]